VTLGSFSRHFCVDIAALISEEVADDQFTSIHSHSDTDDVKDDGQDDKWAPAVDQRVWPQDPQSRRRPSPGQGGNRHHKQWKDDDFFETDRSNEGFRPPTENVLHTWENLGICLGDHEQKHLTVSSLHF